VAASAKDIQLMELKDSILQLNQTIQALNQLIASQQEAINSAKEREEEHVRQESALKEQIDYLTKKLFGSSSERRMDDVSGQLNLFDEAETSQNPDESEPVIETVVKEHTRKPKAPLSEKLKGIPVEEIPVEVPDVEKICPQCGTPLELIGKEDIRHEMEYIPAKVKIKKYISLHYGCPECKNTDEPYIIKGQLEKKPLMKHSLASPSAVAWTMYQKYANGMPLYRQEKDWKQYTESN